MDPERWYNLAYEYDQGGNRTKKTQTFGPFDRIEVDYEYDLDDPVGYGSKNNRLRKNGRTRFTRDFDPIDGPLGAGGPGGGAGTMGFGGGGGMTETPLSTTYYYYNEEGNVSSILTEFADPAPGEPQTSQTRLYYAANGQTLTYVLGRTWVDDQPYTITYAREFRYDGGRQRYLNRQVDPDDGWDPLEDGEEIWSDYDGDEIYGDFTIDGSTVTEKRSFEVGIGQINPWAQSGSLNTQYYHANQIGTTRFMTDSGGQQVAPAVYTAFGERISGTMTGPGHRYAYAGAWGYGTHADFPYLHVGARYYDPATGRFLQRDPIGIIGGLNVYSYLESSPVFDVDPSGTKSLKEKLKRILKAIKEALKRVVPGHEFAGALDCAPDATRAFLEDAKRRHIYKDHPDDPFKDCPTCTNFDLRKKKGKPKVPPRGGGAG